jgi:hypothetical protein
MKASFHRQITPMTQYRLAGCRFCNYYLTEGLSQAGVYKTTDTAATGAFFIRGKQQGHMCWGVSCYLKQYRRRTFYVATAAAIGTLVPDQQFVWIVCPTATYRHGIQMDIEQDFGLAPNRQPTDMAITMVPALDIEPIAH